MRDHYVVRNWPITRAVTDSGGLFEFNVFSFGLSDLTVSDSHLDFTGSGERRTSFMNPVNSRQNVANFDNWRFAKHYEDRPFVTQMLLDMDSLGETHERYATSVLAEVSVIGGFLAVSMGWASLVYSHGG